MLIRPLSIEKTWATLSKRRLTWALDAYDGFIASLSDEVRERFPKGDAQGEAYVVVFGKTQVGKTTLILDLMGISGSNLEKVSKVLRGGRKAGKSATATAMEYRRSNDDKWGFSDGTAQTSGSSKRYDDSEMEVVLGGVRKRMVEKCLESEKPFIVWLPQYFFDSEKNDGFSVRMLDLPGDQAANEVERKHVQQMAQKYVPNADLILLVGKGDDLSFLKPDSLELPSIEDWQIVPNRFRIITTYSFTAQSVRAVMKQKKTVDAEFFRRRLLEQIGTFGLKLEGDAADIKRFFPLEFGDSWVTADPEQVTALEPVIRNLKDQLHKDIKASATAIVRLRNAVSVHVTVGKIKRSRLKQMDEVLKEVKKSLKNVGDDCKIAEGALKDARMQTDAAKYLVDELPIDKLSQQAQRGVKFEIQTMLKQVTGLGTNTSQFKFLISQFTSDLRAQFLTARPIRQTPVERKFWASVPLRLEHHVDKVDEIIEAEFGQLRSKFSGYSLTEYYPRFSDDFSNDKQSMRTHMQNSADSAGAWAAKQWEVWAKKQLRRLSDDVESSTKNQNDLDRALKERSRVLNSLEGQIECSEQERNTFIKKMEADETSSHEFVDLLEQAYLDEVYDRRGRITEASSASHAFVELLATDQLINDRNKLMNTLS